MRGSRVLCSGWVQTSTSERVGVAGEANLMKKAHVGGGELALELEAARQRVQELESRLGSNGSTPTPTRFNIRDERGQLAQVSRDFELQAVLDAFPFYVMIVDADHRIVLANAAVRESLNVEPSAVIGGYCPKVIHGTDDPYPGCPLESAVASGCSVECELVDEEAGHVMASAVYELPIVNEAGVPLYLHTARDISQQRHAEERIRRGRDRQRLLNEVLRVALEPLSLESVLTRILGLLAASSWLGFGQAGAVYLADDSQTLLRLVAFRPGGVTDGPPAHECAATTGMFGRAVSTGGVVFASQWESEDSALADCESSHGACCVPIVLQSDLLGVLALCVRDGHGADPGEMEFLRALAGVLATVIQRKKMELSQETHARVARSRERMARVGEIAAGVAHTVRNPLHGVLNCVASLEREMGQDADKAETLSMMREGIRRIDVVTHRLLRLTRSGPLYKHKADPNRLITDVAGMLEETARQAGVAIEAQCADVPRVAMDIDRVSEALMAVVGNAIDACSAGGKVTLRLEHVRDPVPLLAIEVIDDGEGIPQENLGKVLDPFFTTKPIGKGSGLGLAMARQTVEGHDGQVKISSRPGFGTTVRLEFGLTSATSS